MQLVRYAFITSLLGKAPPMQELGKPASLMAGPESQHLAGRDLMGREPIWRNNGMPLTSSEVAWLL